MSTLDLLLHVKSTRDRTESIDLGLRLARQLGSRAHGFLTRGELARTWAQLGRDTKLRAERESAWNKKSAQAESRFRDALKDHGVKGTSLVGEGQASERLCLVGRVHDFVVVEQNDPGVDDIDWDPAEESVLGSGVPTLVVPKVGAFPCVGRHIAIAWNHGEATLAVRGALPLLQSADSVVVIAGKRREAFASIVRAPQHDIAGFLGRTGLSVDERPFRPAEGESPHVALLSAVRETGADMLVMGAFGRSWLREWIFGGSTRHVLRNMDLPVLFAH